MCGWSCDSDYRGLKKRIMAIKSSQQGGNELHLTRTMSSDSDHDAFPSGSGASKGVDSVNHRENVGGGRTADAQDSLGKQKTVEGASGTQTALEEPRGDELPIVGAVLLSQCVHSIFFFQKDDLHTPGHPLC